MRCPHEDCGNVFCYSPSGNGSAGEAQVPLDEGTEYDVMMDLLAEDDGRAPALIKPKPTAPGHISSPPNDPISAIPRVPESPLPRSFRSRITRQPVPGHPLAQASERSKVVLIGGKGVRFDEPRKYMGVLIGFLILAGGYGCFWGLKAVVDYSNKAGEIRAASLKKKFEEGEALKKQKLEDLVKKLKDQQAPVPSAPAAKTVVARAPAITATVAVALKSAQIGPFFPNSQQEFLVVTLLVTNNATVENHTAAWPGPDVKVSLRDASFQQPSLVHKAFENKKIVKGQPIQQVVVFERPPLGANLTLRLEIPEGLSKKNCTIEIPASAIR